MKKQNDKKRRSVAKRASALFGALIVIVSVLTIPLGAVSPNINQSWLSWHQIYSDTPTNIVKKVWSWEYDLPDIDLMEPTYKLNAAHDYPLLLYFQHYNSYEMGDGSGRYYVSYELLSLDDGSHFFVSMTESNGGRLRIGYFYKNDQGTWNTDLLHDQAFSVYDDHFEIFAKYCWDAGDILCDVVVLLEDGTRITAEHRVPYQSHKVQVKGQNANIDFAFNEGTIALWDLYGIDDQFRSSDYSDGYQAGYDAGYTEGHNNAYDYAYGVGYETGQTVGHADGVHDAIKACRLAIRAYLNERLSALGLGFVELPNIVGATGEQVRYKLEWVDGLFRDITQTVIDSTNGIFLEDLYAIFDESFGLFDYTKYPDLRSLIFGFADYGYKAGEGDGTEAGYQYGYNAGYNAGYLEGLRNEWQGKLIALLREKGVIVSDGASPPEVFKALYDYGWTACADQGSVTQRIIFTALEAPVNIVLGAMNFDVFGVNIAGAIYTILAMVVALFILRIVIDIIV